MSARAKRTVLFLLLAVVFFGMICFCVGFLYWRRTTPPSDYRRLRSLPIFSDTKYGQWAGSGDGLQLETELEGKNPTLPIDQEKIYQGFPSYRVRVFNGENPSQASWWLFILAGNNWESYSLTPYYPDGKLLFNIKGDQGGEAFKISLQDIGFERDVKHFAPVTLPITRYVTVTDRWQQVEIPITDLVPSGSKFRLDQIYSLNIESVSPAPLTFWLNHIRWESAESEPSYPVIKINQDGYLTAGEKYATISGFREQLSAEEGTKFFVRRYDNDEIVWEGALKLVATYDGRVSGERIFSADFSGLQEAGSYYIVLQDPGVAPSLPFEIADDRYRQLLTDGLRYFYLQRQGIALEERYAGPFKHGVGHPQDSSAEFESGSHPPKDVSQGWYDAGDYGKYVNAGATAVTDLLWAYELFPDQFSDGQSNIPESGNGVPDILDELRWELDWMLKMQDPNSGGFYHMVQPTVDGMPDFVITTTRQIMDKSGETADLRPTSTTASAVAGLAHAASVFRPIDPSYAEQLQNSAEAGWQYLLAHPEMIPIMPGPYADYVDPKHPMILDLDDRLWAAAALYRLTGEASYSDFVVQHYLEVRNRLDEKDENGYGVGEVAIPAFLIYLSAEKPNPVVADWFKQKFETWRELMIQRNQTNPWQTTLLEDDYYWGSNNVALNTPMALVIGSKVLGNYDERIGRLSVTALNYVLGINPLSFSYVTGYGSNSVKKPFSMIWNFDGLADPPPGILVGGANEYNNPLIASRFAGKRYIDNASAWSSNEHTIYWNSALVFNTAHALAMNK